jgi:hypothetical protein
MKTGIFWKPQFTDLRLKFKPKTILYSFSNYS